MGFNRSGRCSGKAEGLEQNKFSSGNLFSMADKLQRMRAGLEINDENAVFDGEIRYGGVSHKRQIAFDIKSSRWQIEDDLISSKPLKGTLGYHLAPGLAFDHGAIITKGPKEKIASIEISGGKLHRDQYHYSPQYSVKREAECLKAEFQANSCVMTIRSFISSKQE